MSTHGTSNSREVTSKLTKIVYRLSDTEIVSVSKRIRKTMTIIKAEREGRTVDKLNRVMKREG